MPRRVFIRSFSVLCALGVEKAAVAEALFSAAPNPVSDCATLNDGRVVPVGRVALADTPEETRTNTLLKQAYAPLHADIDHMVADVGPARVGVIVGGCTSGVGEGGAALAIKLETGAWPAGYSLATQQLGDTARRAASLSGATGPCYGVSTACTSGARALISGARLIQAGICDAVLCGAADALCPLTLHGFAALESLSDAPSNPMSLNRKGLNIGEGAALFLLTHEEGPHRLAGWGESADGHHISAPDPSGAGAERAIRSALAMSDAAPNAITFAHLHGTGTRLNDSMEAGVINRVFGSRTPCASTKPMTGHTLGAAGAVQAALCLLAIERGQAPPHLWDGARDPELAPIHLAAAGETIVRGPILSASYAFGGNNAALVLAAA